MVLDTRLQRTSRLLQEVRDTEIGDTADVDTVFAQAMVLFSQLGGGCGRLSFVLAYPGTEDSDNGDLKKCSIAIESSDDQAATINRGCQLVKALRYTLAYLIAGREEGTEPNAVLEPRVKVVEAVKGEDGCQPAMKS